jgi:hypothetical protein
VIVTIVQDTLSRTGVPVLKKYKVEKSQSLPVPDWGWLWIPPSWYWTVFAATWVAWNLLGFFHRC